MTDALKRIANIAPCKNCGKRLAIALDGQGDAAYCQCAYDARVQHIAPLLLAALRALIISDNCGYLRETMRYEGLFDAGREAIRQASGEDLTPGVQLHTTVTVYGDLDLATAAQALLEKLDVMTTEAFSRGEEREERETLRAILAGMGRIAPPEPPIAPPATNS
jgi:hypothetical protein